MFLLASQHCQPRRVAPKPWNQQPTAPPTQDTSTQALATRQRPAPALRAASTRERPAGALHRQLGACVVRQAPGSHQHDGVERQVRRTHQPQRRPRRATLQRCTQRCGAVTERESADAHCGSDERRACQDEHGFEATPTSPAMATFDKVSSQRQDTSYPPAGAPDARCYRARVPQKQQRAAPGAAACSSSSLAGRVRLRHTVQQRSRDRVCGHERQHLHGRVSAHDGTWRSTVSGAEAPPQRTQRTEEREQKRWRVQKAAGIRRQAQRLQRDALLCCDSTSVLRARVA